MAYIDVHSHILPGVDDGARSINESLQLIAKLKKQGVTRILATPHFYASVCSLEDTVKKAQDSYADLKMFLTNADPQIKIGYEVHYFKNISKIDDIEKLTIDGTRFLLLELAHMPSLEPAAEDIISLVLDRHITPILAHIERFALLPGFDRITETIKDGFSIGQINASAFSINRKSKKIALRLIKEGYGQIIASDTHSVNSRPPEFDNAFKIIGKKLGEDTVKKIMAENNILSEKIFKR